MFPRLFSISFLAGLAFCAHSASAQGVTYTYDNAGRLIIANYGAGGAVTYTYTAAGHLITRLPPAPALTIAKIHSGNFTQGQNGAAYTITVSNTGSLATNAAVQVSDTLPTGLTAVSALGTGWTCVLGPPIGCNRSDPLAAGGSYIPITVTVNVAANAPASIINTATVTGGGASTGASASDTTTINPSGAAAWTITEIHSGAFTQGQNGATYTITVTNSGTAATANALVQVVDTLPSGLTAVSMSGSNWICNVLSPPAASCNTLFSNADSLAPGANYPPITLTVNVAANATSPQVNSVSVSGGGVTASGSTTDSTVITASATQVTIQTSPPGLQFSVDGGAAQTAPQTLSLSQGPHTIAVANLQAGVAGTQYAFTGWSDSGAASHSINVGTSAATYTATFKTQYQLTVAASPAAGGTATPASGTFYDSGTVVPIAATANSGYTFNGWSGTVASAGSASTTVTMSAPESVAANFSPLAGITIQTSPPGLQISVDGGPHKQPRRR